MIKNYLRATIIVLAQTILPILTLLALAPWLINKTLINQWQQSLVKLKPWFFALHVFFYLALVLLWPHTIKKIQVQNQISDEQIKPALNARWYLLAIFLFIDALIGLRLP